ncbi:P-loop containing nucleoside triphosphate hydrolases superfamily protein [Artemisia annua]|uniref:P-loop containing nucleoside triphosphate hydrolases superfamily protein n=1 Tax=Artemisia annua TaxID=35608 RepID=A0A2U1N660_ARTAN|nr:P-loop containing nucleoside triphosphate hydrolases superfamily protein [Artemisia annua]
MENRETKLQKLVSYVARATFSSLVIFVGLKYLDPNREASKKALERRKEISKRLGRPLIDTNSYEDVIASNVINPDHIDVELNSIGGLEAIKQSLYDLVILPLRRPELFSYGKLLGPHKGVLLYGPPGTGKTMLAKAIAKESGAVFINVTMSDLTSKYFGDTEKLGECLFRVSYSPNVVCFCYVRIVIGNVTILAQWPNNSSSCLLWCLAYKLQPAIIFIDEVDSFLGQRRTTDHETFTNMKTEFMALWDGFTTDQNAQVMVLAATNRPSELDEAILRRLPQAFEIRVPDRKERAAILKVILKGERAEDDIDLDSIAAFCEGYTGSDLLDLCKKAAYFPIRDLLNEEKKGKSSPLPRPLSQADLERVAVMSKTTKVAASEYSILNMQSEGLELVGSAQSFARTNPFLHTSILAWCWTTDPRCSAIDELTELEQCLNSLPPHFEVPDVWQSALAPVRII